RRAVRSPAAGDGAHSARSAQLNEKSSPPFVQGRTRRIIERGRQWRKSRPTSAESICPSRMASVIWRRSARASSGTSLVSAGRKRAKGNGGGVSVVGARAPLGRAGRGG